MAFENDNQLSNSSYYYSSLMGTALALIAVPVIVQVLSLLLFHGQKKHNKELNNTNSNLAKDLDIPLPWYLRLVGIILNLFPFNFWELDATKLLKKAAKDAGMSVSDFSPSVIEGIEKLCNSIQNDNVQFHWVGLLNMHDSIVTGLSYYLQVKKAHDCNPKLTQVELSDNDMIFIFVVGLPRSGTTHLHRLLSLSSPNARSIALWEHFFPLPPNHGLLDIRRLFTKIQFIPWQKMAYRYGLDAAHYIRPDLPDECNISMRQSGVSYYYWSAAPVYDYVKWLDEEADFTESYLAYKRLLQLLLYNNDNNNDEQEKDFLTTKTSVTKRFFVLKCPSHCTNLNTILKVFPNAKFVFTHRYPDVIPPSYCSLNCRVHAFSVDTSDWQRTVLQNAKRVYDSSTSLVEFDKKCILRKQKIIYHAPYHELIRDPMKLINDIYNYFELPDTNNNNDKNEHLKLMKEYLNANKQHSRGRHIYSLKGTGLSQKDIDNGLRTYKEHFSNYLQKTDNE